ncbi:hypothetical protein L2E82_16124 [Cichorium intybus]|uniref:Uncharacterized protein n=1 Tax=Cichorium intybus TaxID=13427 RepID=A0ACB9F565_CICIN|nr:hypothetical protein L2E82_16124 [Cichorium intybus]
MITCIRPLSSSSNHSLLSYTFPVDGVVLFDHSFVYRHESSRHSPLKTIAQSDSPELLASASFHRSSQRNAHIVRDHVVVEVSIAVFGGGFNDGCGDRSARGRKGSR